MKRFLLTCLMLACFLLLSACSGQSNDGQSIVLTIPMLNTTPTAPGEALRPAETPSASRQETETLATTSVRETTTVVSSTASEAASVPTQATETTLPVAETTAAPTIPEETTTAAVSQKPGLWEPVPTAEADWATRAVSEIYYTNDDFGFPTYVSTYDRDGDGIEDQADILQGARDYVATRPEYDTAYFPGGWAPAGKGVCTDVAAYALLAAGYNLQELVARDVALRPQAYEWEVGDANIDFRRTRNLLVFCEAYLDHYTLDPYDYEAWQPGDIVIFANPVYGMWPGHIAIVSDRRASDGLPYLIHHTDNNRYSYEEDYLTTSQRIIRGHYRVGNLAAHSELFEEP